LCNYDEFRNQLEFKTGLPHIKGIWDIALTPEGYLGISALIFFLVTLGVFNDFWMVASAVVSVLLHYIIMHLIVGFLYFR
jgi:hypothetical protein